MRDLSNIVEIKKFCKLFTADKFYSDNLQKIELVIEAQKEAGNINWEDISTRCRSYIGAGLRVYGGVNREISKNIRLVDKIYMADNLLEYFKNKHGCK